MDVKVKVYGPVDNVSLIIHRKEYLTGSVFYVLQEMRPGFKVEQSFASRGQFLREVNKKLAKEDFDSAMSELRYKLVNDLKARRL